MRLAKSIERLGTETAFEVLAEARALEAEGREIVHLEIGEPDFDTPLAIREAAKRALDEGYTHYGPSAGLPELRTAVARWVSRSRSVEIHPSEVVVTPGAKPIIFFSILALVEPGDEVITPDPAFPIYESMVRFVGGKPVPVALREEEDFRLNVTELKRKVNSNTKLIILNSPHNPTGGILTLSDLREIADVTLNHQDLMILSDEIYSEILYEGRHESPISMPSMKGRVILLDGFSKTYAMTGWRAGYGVMPEPLAAVVARLMTNSNSCTATFTQRACLAAFSEGRDWVGGMVNEFRRRRDVIVEGLNQIPGFSCKKPAGAFYVFPNIKKTGMTSREAARALLHEAGVGTLSGASFGKQGEGYLRFSYANSIENIRKALQSIERWCARAPAAR